MPRKKYGDALHYENKLKRVMERLGVTNYTFDWGRYSTWIQFTYKGELYRFEHSVEKAQQRGLDLAFGSDCFAQLVLALEDLARMVERGIYDLSTWVVGMRYLPPAAEIPTFFQFMGFKMIPSFEQYKERYKELAKQLHPDNSGSPEGFKALQRVKEQAENWFIGNK